MSDPERATRVGVRELRQNLSVYLDRVREGERLVVTEHGRPVAELGPLASATVPVLDRLVAEGRARAAGGSLGAVGLPPEPGPRRSARSVTDELLALRAEEPW